MDIKASGNHLDKARNDRVCNACGGLSFSVLGRRSDDLAVLCCETCGLGVVESIPESLEAFYDDAYYGIGRTDERIGYSNYSYTSEHGVSWAAAFVQMLNPAGGRVLDVGCADGTLLSKLPASFECYGIEVNTCMAALAEERGIWILGRDLLDPALLREYGGRFDVVTAIAVLEHLSDIRRGVQIALELLRPDGVLLFEVPYISSRHDNRVWFESSLEHIYYPSGSSMRNLVEDLGAYLVGGELYIQDFACNYVGIAFRNRMAANRLQRLFNVLANPSALATSDEEQQARQMVLLVHAAHSTPELVRGWADLPDAKLNKTLLRRFEQLWLDDLRRLAALREECNATASARDWHATQAANQAALLEEASARETALREECNATASARDWHATQVANQAALLVDARAQLSGLATQLETVQADYRLNLQNLSSALQVQENAARQAKHEALPLTDRLADATMGLEALRAQLAGVFESTSWKVTYPLRRFAEQHPASATLLRRAGKLAWWSVRLELRARLRQVLRARKQTQRPFSAASAIEPPVLPPLAFHRHNGVPVNASGAPVPDWTAPDDDQDPWPTDRPLVSVVIPSFNYGRFLDEAVDSVLAQTFTDLEIIVVEGGSTDETSRQLALALNRPRTRIVVQTSPHFAGANRNFGIWHARGKYICCLDADDKLAPTYIEKAIYLLEEHGYDVVSSATEYFGRRADRVGTLEIPTLSEMLEGNHMLVCAVFRRDLWCRAGGYRDTDPSVTGYVYEDWMFWVRLAALGARMLNICREYLFYYRDHQASTTHKPNHYAMDIHRLLVAQANTDLISQEAIDRSRRAANEDRQPAVPLRNLVTHGPADSRRPVLLLALPFTILGGAERLLSSIVHHLANNGWRVLITTSIDPGSDHCDTTAWFEHATPEIYHLPRFLAPERWEGFVRYLIASREVDVLWVVGSAFVYDLLPALVSDFRHLRVADLLFNPVVHIRNNRRHADHIALTFVENEEVKRFLVDAGEVEERIAFCPSGIDLDTYRPGPRDPEVVRTIGAEPSDFIVGFSGRLAEEKDPLTFVEVARRTPQELPVRFVMTGAGPLRSQVEEAVRTAALPPGRFHFAGPVADVAPWLRSYDALLLPSRLDGRPLVVMEALAVGVPVIASRVGALPELVEENVNGFLCPPGDAGVFVERITILVRNRTRVANLKSAARRYAECHLDARVMLQRYEELLRGLASS
jgi:glycosyltransferase involved in cell wall biosynthesis/SAM-dependent methyltransferase